MADIELIQEELNKEFSLAKGLEGLSDNIKAEIINKIFHTYPKLKEQNDEYKIKLYNGVGILNKVFGYEYTSTLILGGKLANSDQEVVNPIDPDEIINHADEIAQLKEKGDLNVNTLKALFKSELEILQSQIVQPKTISSYEIIKSVDIKDPEFKKELEQISSNIENANLQLIETFGGNSLSLPVKKNMAAGMGFMIMDFLSHADKDTKKSFFDAFKNFAGNEKDVMDRLIGAIKNVAGFMIGSTKFAELNSKIVDFMKLFEDEDLRKVVGTGNTSKILSNPVEYKKLLAAYVKGEKSAEQIKEEIKKSTDDKTFTFKGLSESENKDLKDTSERFFTNLTVSEKKSISAGSKILGGFMDNLGTIKSKGKDMVLEHGPLLVGIKQFAEQFGMWDNLKKLFEVIFKFLGWKSFDDFEDEFTNESFNGSVGRVASGKNRNNPKAISGHSIDISDIKDTKLGDLNFEQSKKLFTYSFGTGAGTDLAIKMSEGSNVFLTRITSLARHEGGFDFGMTNQDPNKASHQYNIGTFQLSEPFRPNYNVIDKYLKNLKVGLKLAGNSLNIDELIKDPSIRKVNKDNFRDILTSIQDKLYAKGLTMAQQDLLAWFGYVESERNTKAGGNLFGKLKDSTLPNKDIVKLMSTEIQSGISAIGKDVAAQEDNLSAGSVVKAGPQPTKIG